MANKYTDAQKKASLKYQADKAQIKITVTPEQRERFQKLASDRNKSLTKLIVDLLEEVEFMKIYVADREAGNFIEEVKSVEEGKALIAKYEEKDKADGTYEADFYDVVDENHISLM